MIDSPSSEHRESLRLLCAEDLPRAELVELVGTSEELMKSHLYESIEKLLRALRPLSP